MLTFKKCLKKTNKNEKLIKATKIKDFRPKIPCTFGLKKQRMSESQIRNSCYLLIEKWQQFGGPPHFLTQIGWAPKYQLTFRIPALNTRYFLHTSDFINKRVVRIQRTTSFSQIPPEFFNCILVRTKSFQLTSSDSTFI